MSYPTEQELFYKQMRMYHGTHMSNVIRIALNGFRPSTGGCLGAGFYFAPDFSKAENFAVCAANTRQTKTGSKYDLFEKTFVGVFECMISTKKCKSLPLHTDDREGKWRQEGYDSIRTESTTRSRRPEFNLKSASQIKVVKIHIIRVKPNKRDRWFQWPKSVLKIVDYRNKASKDDRETFTSIIRRLKKHDADGILVLGLSSLIKRVLSALSEGLLDNKEPAFNILNVVLENIIEEPIKDD